MTSRQSIKILFLIAALLISANLSAVPYRTPTEPAHEQDPLMHHLSDHGYIEFPGIKIELPRFEPVKVGSFTLDFSLTNHFAFYWLGFIILILVLRRFKKKKLVQTGFMGQMVEAIVLFVRDDIVKPSMPHDYNKFLPFFLTLFFFLLLQDIIGLFPFMSQATKNLSVTSAFAVIVFIVWQIAAVSKHGFIGYMKTFMPIKKGDMAAPAVIGMNIFLFPLEFMQIITKPFALSIRLFANMVAGHAVILTFLLLGWNSVNLSWNIGVIIPGVFGAVFIYVLEILVAFLQAYVFTLLSAMFIGNALEESH